MHWRKQCETFLVMNLIAANESNDFGVHAPCTRQWEQWRGPWPMPLAIPDPHLKQFGLLLFSVYVFVQGTLHQYNMVSCLFCVLCNIVRCNVWQEKKQHFERTCPFTQDVIEPSLNFCKNAPTMVTHYSKDMTKLHWNVIHKAQVIKKRIKVINSTKLNQN